MIHSKSFRIHSVILSEAKNLTVFAEILPVGQNDKCDANRYTLFILRALIVI